MTMISKRLTARLAPLVIGLGAAGLAMGATQASSADDSVSCEIEARQQNGMIAMRGVVHSETPISGSYEFKVRSAGHGGSSDISQGGRFSAGPDGPATLGQVQLGGSPAYDATLYVNADGMTIECAERFEGLI